MDTLACDGDQQLKMVSIVGSGGLGKTTFARVLYNKIRGQFDCRALVSMIRKPRMTNVLRDILTQVQRQQASDNCEHLDITGRIRKHLHGKRYGYYFLSSLRKLLYCNYMVKYPIRVYTLCLS